MDGLGVYVFLGEAEINQYTPLWVQWLRQHYPQWAIVDIDSRSDSSLLSYLQKAVDEHNRLILFVDAKSKADARLGQVLPLMQRLVRNQPSQCILILQGQHQLVERMGLAFSEFYQTASDEETTEVLHRALRGK